MSPTGQSRNRPKIAAAAAPTRTRLSVNFPLVACRTDVPSSETMRGRTDPRRSVSLLSDTLRRGSKAESLLPHEFRELLGQPLVVRGRPDKVVVHEFER